MLQLFEGISATHKSPKPSTRNVNLTKMTSTISIHDNIARPRIGVTMGDPSGIGPEICVKILNDSEVLAVCQPIIFGDILVLESYAATCRLKLPTTVINASTSFKIKELSTVETAVVIDFGNSQEHFPPAAVSAASGAAAFNYIDTAISSHESGLIEAIVTGPINKLSLNAAGHDYPGHTELFAAKTKSNDFCMLQYSPVVSCSFVTTHCGYLEVVNLLSVDRILHVLQLTNEAFKKIEQRNPKLIVCGLNPHSGENGLFGNCEEEKFIAPAVEAARQLGIDVSGPFPPDTCFTERRRREFDCVVCMYHDQGHIPLKALAFDQAVNTTLGLPLIRTSVDHGTAFDIVGKNQANPSSFIEAIKLAAKLARNRNSANNIRQPHADHAEKQSTVAN